MPRCRLLPASLLFVLTFAAEARAQVALPNAPTATVLPATGTPTDAELDDAWARALIHANPGPFQYLAYEVTARGRAAVVSHVRGNMGRKDPIARTELLSRARFQALMTQLRVLGAWELPRPEPPQPVPTPAAKAARPATAGKTAKARAAAAEVGLQAAVNAEDPLAGPPQSSVPYWEISVRLGGRENTLLVRDPFGMDDRRYAKVIELIRDLTITTAGDIAYAGPTGGSGVAGYLYIDSVPSAKVWVDGEPLPEETPILAFTVSPGTHTVTLENARLGLRREYKVKVQSGLTSSLEVELR
jgi:hypothetical protein